MHSKRTPAVLPVLALLLGATMWGLIWYPTRLLEQAGMPSLWVVLAMYCAALAAGAWIFRAQWREYRAHPVALAVLALSAGWCNVAFFIAVIDGLVVRVVLLFYLSPVWTVLLGRVVLGEHLTPRAVVVLVLAMTGAMIMLWVPAIGVPWPQGRADWLAISAGMGFSVTNVAVRYLQGVTVRAKGAANWIGVVLVALVAVAVSDPTPPPVAPGAWLGAFALGLFAIILMTVSVQYGVTRMPVHRSAIILLFELVVGAVSSHVLVGEVVGLREWLGGALIVAASLVSARTQVEQA